MVVVVVVVSPEKRVQNFGHTITTSQTRITETTHERDELDVRRRKRDRDRDRDGDTHRDTTHAHYTASPERG